MSSIHDLEFKNGVLALIGIIEDSFLCFKSYKIDLEVFFKFKSNNNNLILLFFKKNHKESGQLFQEYEEIAIIGATEAKFLSNKLENSFTVLSQSSEVHNSLMIRLIEFNKDKWSCSFIKNLKSFLNINYSSLDQLVFTHENRFLLLIYYKNELFVIDIKNDKSIEAQKTFNDTTTILDYFIKSTKLTDGKLKYFYQVENTNDFISLNNLKQLVYIKYLNNEKVMKIQIIVNSKLESSIDKIGLFKHILFAYSSQKNELYAYSLKTGNKNEIFSNQILKKTFSENKLKFACTSDDCNYIATFEEQKFLSIFRLSDARIIAYVSIYNEINSIQMSHYFVVLGMQDRRILSYLLVDPLIKEHEKRTSELESRYHSKVPKVN